MMRLTLNISQRLSLQLTTTMALDKGIKDVHDIVGNHEKEQTSTQFINDIKSVLLRANKKSLFIKMGDKGIFLKNDLSLLERSISYAANRHRGEYRDSGHPYAAHVISTGFILARLGMPKEVILAGILHDAVEDTQDKTKVLNDLYALAPAIAWYVYTVSGPDIVDSVEKDKILYQQLDSFSANSGSHFIKAIKCADSIANLYDLEFISPKDGRTGPDRQKKFIENIRQRILPYAREIDLAGLIPLKTNRELFSLEEYLQGIIDEKSLGF